MGPSILFSPTPQSLRSSKALGSLMKTDCQGNATSCVLSEKLGFILSLFHTLPPPHQSARLN